MQLNTRRLSWRPHPKASSLGLLATHVATLPRCRHSPAGRKDGHVLMTLPRVAVLRTFLLNHLYHHRGQLATYLRILDVPVPSIYGASGDENPFA